MEKRGQRLVQFLGDGVEQIKKQSEIEISIGLGRAEITRLLINEDLPIGSTAKGYFLIDTQDEFNMAIESINGRIDGLTKRKEAITRGWEKRTKMRKKNINYPKDGPYK